MSAARLVGTALLVGTVATVMALLGFDAVNIALAATAVAAVGGCIGGQDLGRDAVLPRLPSESRGGYRREVSQLSSSLTDRDGRVTAEGARQLREAARSRLASTGVDPDDDAAVSAALGERALHVLRAQAPPSARQLHACLTALEHHEGARP